MTNEESLVAHIMGLFGSSLFCECVYITQMAADTLLLYILGSSQCTVSILNQDLRKACADDALKCLFYIYQQLYMAVKSIFMCPLTRYQ